MGTSRPPFPVRSSSELLLLIMLSLYARVLRAGAGVLRVPAELELRILRESRGVEGVEKERQTSGAGTRREGSWGVSGLLDRALRLPNRRGSPGVRLRVVPWWSCGGRS